MTSERKLRVGSLFSGIGGLDLGLERAGFDIAWMCEANEWCRQVLNKHWPNIPCYHDVRDINREAPPVDVICGGFPCQPVSFAGKGLAQADDRWLWPEVARIVRLLRPRYLIVENVPGLLARGMGDVLGDLAACGYDAEWDCIPAAAVGAPHRRDRVYVVAYPHSGCVRWSGTDAEDGGQVPSQEPQRIFRGSGRSDDLPRAAEFAGQRRSEDVADAVRARRTTRLSASRHRQEGIAEVAVDGSDRLARRSGCGEWTVEPGVGRVAHGIPHRVDRLRGLGNAVVPQVAELIGRRVMEMAA